jgi:hypothetical protein
MNRKCGEGMERMSQSCCERKRADKLLNSLFLWDRVGERP